jgi:hypothetical protein
MNAGFLLATSNEQDTSQIWRRRILESPKICKISGFHGGDYEECRLGYKNPVRTSQETPIRYRAQPVNAMQDLRFSWRWLWRMPSSGILHISCNGPYSPSGQNAKRWVQECRATLNWLFSSYSYMKSTVMGRNLCRRLVPMDPLLPWLKIAIRPIPLPVRYVKNFETVLMLYINPHLRNGVNESSSRDAVLRWWCGVSQDCLTPYVSQCDRSALTSRRNRGTYPSVSRVT